MSKLEYNFDLDRFRKSRDGVDSVLADYTKDTFSIKTYGISGPTAGLAGLFEPGPSIKQT